MNPNRHCGFSTLFDHCSLVIVHSLKIACPALNPERSSLQSDYGASRFSAVDNCKLLIGAAGGRD